MENKDWKGNEKSVYLALGASNHTDRERQHEDFYATEPKAIELLLREERLSNVWECAVGEGHLANVLAERGVLGRGSDLVDRCGGKYETLDFLSMENTEKWDGDIVTNPPYRYAEGFIEKALSLVDDGRKVCMFLRLQFLEGKRRKELYRLCPPRTCYVSSSRIACAMNGDFENMKGSAVAYMWLVWEKGYKGTTELKWIN
jgi:hypothetical protein